MESVVSMAEDSLLPEGFVPSDNDVICGWARQNYNHVGNRKLRDVISSNVPRYLSAKNKTEKGTVIVEILEKLRLESPSGTGLVRQHPKTLRWAFIGAEKAKDKIGHALRKAAQESQKKSRSRSKQSIRAAASSSSSSTVDSATTSSCCSRSNSIDCEDGGVDTASTRKESQDSGIKEAGHPVYGGHYRPGHPVAYEYPYFAPPSSSVPPPAHHYPPPSHAYAVYPPPPYGPDPAYYPYHPYYFNLPASAAPGDPPYFYAAPPPPPVEGHHHHHAIAAGRAHHHAEMTHHHSSPIPSTP